MIEVRNVYKIYGPRPADVLPLARQGRSKPDILAETGHAVALADVTLGMDAGKSFVVMGLSGSGKSTLIRHLNRLVDPTAGEVRVDGVDVGSLSGRALTEFRRRRTSMVFQRFGLFPHRTVLQNVAYGLTVQRVPRREWEARAGSWIETVGLAGYEGHFPAELSGGMQQRVGLARALCTDPDILLMDEPFSALDPLIRSEMQDQLLALQARLHKTIAFITHDLGEALKLGDRIAILKDGRVVQAGSPQEILLAPADDYVRAFARNVDRGRVLTAEAVMADAVTLVVGQADLGETSRRLEESGSPVAYLLDTGRRLRGVIPAEDVVAAARTPGATLNGSARAVPAASPQATLTALLPMVFASRWPVPVVGDDGAFKGAVTRGAVVAALVADGAPEREEAGAGEAGGVDGPGPRAVR